MSGVPAPIQDLLVKLGVESTSYSPALRVPLAASFRYLLRVFDETPPDEESRAKALRRIADCLDLARAAQATPADRASTPLLEQMERLLRPARSPPRTLVMNEPAPPAHAPAPPPRAPAASAPASDPPSPVWSPAPRGPAPPLFSPFTPAPSPQSRPPRDPPLIDPDSTQALVSRLLAKLAGLSEKRRGLIHDPLDTGVDLRATEQEIDRATRALSWIGPPAAVLAGQALLVAAASHGEAGQPAAVEAGVADD